MYILTTKWEVISGDCIISDKNSLTHHYSQNHMQWFYLAIAILSEVIATSALKASDGFTRWLPSIIVIVGYASAFYFLSLTLRTIPLGVAYAIWSGVGVALITLIGWIVYQQSIGLGEIIGIGLIVSGVIVLNLFSEGEAHWAPPKSAKPYKKTHLWENITPANHIDCNRQLVQLGHISPDQVL